MENNGLTDEQLDLIQEKMDEFSPILEDALHSDLEEYAPDKVGGCFIQVSKNNDGDLKLTIQIGLDSQVPEDYDSGQLIDAILSSKYESDLDDLLDEFELNASSAEYQIFLYEIDE